MSYYNIFLNFILLYFFLQIIAITYYFSIKNLNSLPIRYIINRKGKSQATSPKSN